MQEIALSNDLNQIEFEIKQYEEMTGKGIYEIGRRINWVKQNDLAHGEFLPFLKRVNISKSYAEMFMKIAKDRELGNSQPVGNLGISVLYELTRIPNDMRDKPQQLDSGESKKPVDMTRREIQELNRKLKMAQEENRDKDLQIERLNSQPKPEPKVIEKTVTKEVTPSDYDALKREATVTNDLRQRNNQLQEQIDSLQSDLSKATEQNGEYAELQQKIDALEKQRSTVRKSIDAGANIMGLNDKLREMFDTKLSALKYKNYFADDPMTSTVQETEELLDTLQNFIDDMRRVLPQHERKIIEGKFS